MKYLVILFSFVLSTVVYPATPTPEGLFRHGDNPAPAGDMVVLRLSVKEERNFNYFENTTIGESPEDVTKVMSDLEPERYLKIIISLKDPEKPKALQVEYSDRAMDAGSMEKVGEVINLSEWIKGASLEKGAFYGVLYSLLTNDSSLMSDYLKRFNGNFQTNEELVNTEKKELLNKYQEYLKLVNAAKKAKEPVEDIPHPYQPSDEEGKVKVKELLKSDFYLPSPAVKLLRKSGKFIWALELDNTHAEFEHTSFTLRNLDVKDQSGRLKIIFGDYLSYDGQRTLPKYAIVGTSDNKIYRIGFLSSQSFENNKAIDVRLKEYKTLFDKVNKKRPVSSPELEAEQGEIVLSSDKFIL